MLLPALGKVKEQGNTTQCLNNIKTFCLAALNYSHDYNDLLPLGDDVQYADYSWMWGKATGIRVLIPLKYMSGSPKKNIVLLRAGWFARDTSGKCVRNQHPLLAIRAAHDNLQKFVLDYQKFLHYAHLHP